MDNPDNDLQTGALDVWETFNTSTIALFKNLDQAADGLEILMTHILNIKGEFSDLLVQRASAPENVKKQCYAFNKWLLGRLFCVLSVKKLSRIHKLSISTQLKILSILSANAAPFLDEILAEYITCLGLIIKFYEASSQEVLVLKRFIPDEVDISSSDLDLSPMPVEIQDKEVAQDMIIYLIDILGQTVLSARDFHMFKINNNKVMDEVLYVLENMDMRLKNCAINFFSKMINEFGINSSSKHVNKFLAIIEKLIYTMPLLIDKGSIQNYKFSNHVNGQLCQLFGTIYYHGDNVSEYKKTILLRLCKFILEIDHDRLGKDYEPVKNNVFSLELKDISKQLLEKFITEEEIAALDDTIFESYVKAVPSFFSTKVLSDAKIHWIENDSKVINLVEISSTFKNISSALFVALKSAGNVNFNMFVVSAHLNKCLHLLNILFNFKVNFLNWLQCKNGALQDVLSKSTTNRNVPDVNLKLFSSEVTHQIIKDLETFIQTNLHKSTQPAHELNVITNILTKLLFVGNEMNIADVELILQVVGLATITSNQNQRIRLQHSIEFGKDKNYRNITFFKTLLTQNLCLNEQITMYSAKWKDAIVEVLSSELDMTNFSVQLEVLKCSPLLLLNNIVTPEELAANYLHPALFSKNKDVLQELVQILPLIVCIISKKFIITQSTIDYKYNVGMRLNSVHGLNVNFICKHCCDLDRLTSKESSIKYKSIEKKTFIVSKKPESIYSDTNVARIKHMFVEFLNLKFYIGVPDLDLGNLIITFARHSILLPSSIDDLLGKASLSDLVNILKPLTTNILQDAKLENAIKSSILGSVIRLIVVSSKKSLETNDSTQQELCLECIRQFGLTQSPDVILPSIKLLICFLMYSNCVYGSKASLYIRDICEAQKTTPNKIYFRYKKDFCRVMMEQAAHNFLLGHGCSSSIQKVVKVFGYVGYRDFVSKDVHHALPYLIPILMKTDKLRPVITEMASLTHCTPAEFISKRFPHIYPHIYIYESDDMAKKCFQYIEEITGSSITDLIRKHFRVALTEFLLQYCCGPEKVLKACRWLASIDPDYSPMPLDMNLPLTQVADFIQPRFLGVLACFDTKLVNSKGAISVKRKALQSFPDILNLMGARHMTPLRFKILAILRSALSLMEEFPKLNALAWNAFIHNIDTVVLGPLLTTIFVSLVPLMQFAVKEINEIFEYLIVGNENLLCSHIPDLFFLKEDDISPKVKQIVAKHVTRIQPQNFIDKLKWYLKYLNQDALEIRVHTLKFLSNLIKNSQAEISDAIFGSKDINSTVVELIDILIAGCRDKDPFISEWSGRCLGALGALEPSLLPRHQSAAQGRGTFAFSVRDTGFIRVALSELTRAFQCEKDTKNMDSYALAIQEILKAFNISPSGENKELWDSFPDDMHQIMVPLLSSRYNLAFPLNPKKPNRVHRVYGTNKASTFNEWAFNWASQLIPLIDVRPTQDVLRMVQPSLKRDVRTLVLFLPYILLHTIISNDDNDFLMEEMLAVIGPESFNNEAVHVADIPKYRTSMMLNLTPGITPLILEEGTQLKCRKMVYVLLDFFNRWLLECTHSKKNVFTDKNYVKIKKFLEGFCKLTIAKGNFLCGELERALQYLEMYVTESPSKLQEQLGFLAEIYVVLDEPDCVAGIMRMKQSEPSLSELILAHKVTGQLQDAATCYEKCAQQGDIDDERLQGMVEVYLGLDQPYTALRLLQGAHAGGSNTSGERALAAEPFWRLAMFDDLEKLLEQPNVSHDDRSGVRVGHCLLALRSGQRAALEDRLTEARCALLRRLGEGASSTSELRQGYTHAYNCALGLHMLAEIEHSENAIYKIKELQDGDSACSEILDDLIQEWNLRLRLVQSSARTVEPVLRLRRILLEQSKELLETSHPYTAILLDSHIGKIWLQSAKFARKACIFQQAYIYILNGEKYSPKELFIEKAKLYWMRGQQEPAFYTLKRGLEEHFPSLTQLSPADRKLCAKAKLLKAIYNDETTNVDMDVNITHYKEAVEVYRQWEKSLVCLAAYYERVYAAMGPDEKNGASGGAARARALDSYGRALQHGHSKLYQSMPRMLSIWLDFEVQSTDPKSPSMVTLAQICTIIDTFSERLPLYLFLTAFSQIISRICHPIKEVYTQLKKMVIRLIVAYPQHSLWMMMCVIKSSYTQRIKRCQEILADTQLKEPAMLKFICDFNQLAEKLIELCNKPIPSNVQATHVSTLVRSLPKLLTSDNFSQIMMPAEQFVKLILPFHSAKKEKDPNFSPFPQLVYITGIDDAVTVFPSLQRPRKVTLRGSDGKSYMMMLKPKDDLRKDFRLMEFNAVVNRYLQDNAESRERRLYIRTYSVLPLNEECGIIQWVPNLLGFRPILMNLYKEKGIYTSAKELKELMCGIKDPLAKKRKVFETQLMPKHPPVFGDWFRYTFPDPHTWYQARSAYIRTTAVMSMVGYILGLGDRHGENILFDSTNGDAVHVDFNCLFNRGEAFEWPERVPFRLTHNMQHAMGPLACEGTYRKCCEVTLRVLRSQTATLMSVIRPFVYDPLVAWQRAAPRDPSTAERTNQSAKDHLTHIEQRLQGMVRTKDKQFSLSLSPEGQANNLILEATSVVNLCQMYIGWGPFL